MNRLSILIITFSVLHLVATRVVKAENLISNGFGESGDNSNFPNFTFDGMESFQGHGSFMASGSYQNVRTSELIPYNPNSSYRAEFYAKSSTYVAGSYNYPFLACYDVDGQEISTAHTLFVPGTTTTLSSDLNDGDLYVYVNDLSQWVNPGSFWHRRGIRVWNYTNSLGYTYPAETYSRNYYKGVYGVGLWEEGVGLDYANNRIVLRSPWSGGTIPSGTALSQNSNGGTYLYFEAGEIGPSWTKKSGFFSPEDVLPGTAFVKLGWLLDYGSKGNVVELSAVQLTEVPNKLEVAGTIRAEEIIVEAQPWPDYVFEDGYALPSLEETLQHILEYKRLPGMPSAEEVAEKGLTVGENQRLLLQKIEELTLHLIQQDRTINELVIENGEQRQLINRLLEETHN